jgi:hexosaminidase
MKTIALMLLGIAAFAADVSLMPAPASYAPSGGRLAIDQKFRVALNGYAEPRLEKAAARIIDRIARQTGMPLAGSASTDAAAATLVIETRGASAQVQHLGEDESYELRITPQQARITAANPLGALHGIETFLQLIDQDGQGWAVPAAVIQDSPRFPWRGFSFDVSRHFMPVEIVKRTLDGMAAVKMNVLHWHLSDDQGFRVPSDKYPKIQQLASDGLYYTKDQTRDVIAYARDRGIRVVPEFDMPGHSTALLAAYPELGTAPGPYQIERKWGIFDPALDPTKEEVYKFLDGFIGEMAQLFPDQFFHIGGDEVNGKAWDSSEHVQAFMKAHGIKDNHEFQRYFNSRVQPIVAKYGKRMEGWDEILAPDLPKDIVIQSWRGQKSLAEAARQGYSGILSAGYYLDLMQPASQHYAVDPLNDDTAGLTPEQRARILGGEAAMWVEYASVETLDSRVWPRMAVIAERLWSPQNVRDAESMYRRMEATSRWLEWLGLNHRSNYHLMLQRLAGGAPLDPLAAVANLVEPVKEYEREKTGDYTQQTPLNHLVDAARPESIAAREFNRDVKNGSLEGARLRRTLERWRDNHVALDPIVGQREILSDAAPVSAALTDVATIGLAALASLEGASPKPSSQWVTESRAKLAEAKKQKGALLLMVVPGVEALVDRASGQ